MAVILPIIAIYGGVTAGMAMAAGAAVTFAGAMAVAGGMAAGLGVITGDKDFQRLGSILSAVGGIANAAQGLAGAGEASSGFDIADGSMDAAESAKLARQGAPTDVAPSVGDVAVAAQPGLNPDVYGDLGEFGAAGGMQQPPGQPAGTVAQSSQQIASKLTGGGESMAETFSTAPTTVVDPQGLAATSGQSALQEAASSMTKSDIVSMLERGSANAKSLFGQAVDGAGKTLNAAGQWVQKNPAASNMMFKALEGMYGPEAERLDYERGLMDRARSSLNRPVRLQYQTPKTVGG